MFLPRPHVGRYCSAMGTYQQQSDPSTSSGISPQAESSISGGLSPEAESLLQSAAERIAAHGFESPALFLLEINKPIASVAYAAALVIEPLGGALFGFGLSRAVTELLSCRENLDRLADAIEAKATAKRARN